MDRIQKEMIKKGRLLSPSELAGRSLSGGDQSQNMIYFQNMIYQSQNYFTNMGKF